MAGTRPVRLVAGFVLALALLGGVAWSGWRHTARMQEGAEWVALTHDVQANRNLLLSLMLEIESNQLSYVLTGLPEFLDGFEKAVTRLPQQERRLEELTRDERQKAALSALRPLMAERIAVARRTVELRQNSGAEAAAQEVATLKGQKLTDEILARLALMDARGAELLDERSAAARREAGTTALLTLTGTALSVALLITVFALVLRENRRRPRAEAEVDRFFRLSLDMLCIASADGYFKRVSPAFTETLGWSVKEMLARPFLDFEHPDDRAATLAEVERQVVAGEKVLQFENRYQHKDGSWRILSWKSMPQPDGLMLATARDVTEHKQAAEDIRRLNDELEQRVRERTAELALERATLSAAFESTDQGVVITNPQGGEIVFNAAALRMHGFASSKDMHARIGDYATEWEVRDPAGRVVPFSDWPLPRAIRGDYCRNWEAHLRHLESGHEWDCSYTCVPVRDAVGDVSLIVVTLVDITARKQGEELLQNSERRFRLVFENAGMGIALVDGRGHPVKSNPALQRIVGYTESELAGMSFTEFTYPDDAQRDWTLYRELLEGQRERYVMEKRYIRKDGQVVWANLTVSMMRDGSGKPEYAIGLVEDVTERKQAEVMLLSHKERLAAMVEHQPECVKVVDAQGRLVSMNPAGLAMLEVGSLAELQQKSLADFIVSDYRAAFRDLHQRVMAGGHGALEFEVVGQNGTRRWLETHAAPLRDGAGKVHSLLGITRDITERKRAGEEIRMLNAELEQRVEERTRQWKEANRELDAFNQAMVGREQRIIEMKEEVNALCRELGREPQYPPVWKEVG